MASVPSAGCLLAKNQFYRARLNSESSVCSSSSSEQGLPMDQEKSYQGLPEMIEKCWWLKNFFHCEQVPTSSIRIEPTTARNHS
ncbi:pancreatic progenitor cell differentiation and proliferation factor-like protein [Bombina bombina]|uniref:pancreatic progenitor cell differentiation and proliferation factor-like protein n=1 Tax=Bombina bombina TaxID=8345 RepID=UPI00235AF34A|nr:pancreatic progenitor cell differentiation and proliferation factor-like protein [Bombina bombina]